MRQVDKGPAIDIRGLNKAYGRRVALRDLDLQVPWGTILAVLGPNGSGKTTLIRVLATLAKPDKGDVRIAGSELGSDDSFIRRMIGVVTHDSLLYDELSGLENLQLAAKLFVLDNADRQIELVSKQIGIQKRLYQRVGTLSHGWKKRISIARALLHDPYILLLDEPENGLDQQALSSLDQIIKDDSKRLRSVIMTTHSLERGISLADRFAILSKGRVVYHSSTESAPDPAILRESYFQDTD